VTSQTSSIYYYIALLSASPLSIASGRRASKVSPVHLSVVSAIGGLVENPKKLPPAKLQVAADARHEHSRS
jgi:hypothetical protein